MKTQEISTYEQQAIGFLQATGTTFKTKFKKYASMPWDKDGSKRNIFAVTLRNERGSYTFEFGASINDSTKPVKVFKIDTNEPVTIYTGFGYSERAESIYFEYKIQTTYSELREISTSTKEYEAVINQPAFEKEFSNYTQRIEKYKAKYGNFNAAKHFECYSKVLTNIKKEIEKATAETTTTNEQEDTVKHPSAYDVLTCLTKYDPETFEDFCSNYGYDEDSRTAERTYKAVVKEWKAIERLFTSEELELLQEIQ